MVVNWVVGLVGLTVEIDAGSNGGGSLDGKLAMGSL